MGATAMIDIHGLEANREKSTYRAIHSSRDILRGTGEKHLGLLGLSHKKDDEEIPSSRLAHLFIIK